MPCWNKRLEPLRTYVHSSLHYLVQCLRWSTNKIREKNLSCKKSQNVLVGMNVVVDMALLLVTSRGKNCIRISLEVSDDLDDVIKFGENENFLVAYPDLRITILKPLSLFFREQLVSVLCTINKGGSTVPLFSVFPQVKFNPAFLYGALAGAEVAATKSDWMDRDWDFPLNRDIFTDDAYLPSDVIDHPLCHPIEPPEQLETAAAEEPLTAPQTRSTI
ncbi:unnamed protein product [Lepeophtheirus salmonis]|uniref:(salmon louse) hypothetical protein n=1 Tax=Lepeophtheirus salmonis TaxID=72036 RepID=A0A7R8D5C5_LEPSM|nr:unnamed protein product [Lepeophtheirus salmonis]CAF3033303.1 unnamed protein product [Lepeophtheirus salmonis]